MKTITTGDLLNMSLAPIRTAASRMFLRWQLRSINSHIASLERSIQNDREAVRELQYERALLVLRLK